MIQKVISNTKFTVEEVDRFYLAFSQFSQEGVITKQNFKQLLDMISIRISKPMEDRIFDVVAGVDLSDGSETRMIDFPTLMSYFNTILKGQKLDQIRFCYNLIDRNQKGFFTKEDLRGLLCDLKQIEADEKDDLEDFMSSFFELFGFDSSNPDFQVPSAMFIHKLQQDEKTFLMVRDLLDVQSSLKPNKSIKILNELLKGLTSFMQTTSLLRKTEEIVTKSQENDKKAIFSKLGIKKLSRAKGFKKENHNSVMLGADYVLVLPDHDQSHFSNSQLNESSSCMIQMMNSAVHQQTQDYE